MTTFLLIRHGNSTAGDRLPGRIAGIHLSELGKNEVKELSKRLFKVKLDAIVSSPLERTLETAEILAQPSGLDVEIDHDLNEVDFAEWTGYSFAELKLMKKWPLFHSFRTGTRIPGGEHIIDVQVRMVRAIEKYRDRYPSGIVAVVSHCDPIRSAIVYYAGISIDHMLRICVDTAGVTVLNIEEWGAEFLCINHNGNLPLNGNGNGGNP